MLHRDLKPDNIGFIGGGPRGRAGHGRPVLIDFGCACIVAREEGAEGRGGGRRQACRPTVAGGEEGGSLGAAAGGLGTAGADPAHPAITPTPAIIGVPPPVPGPDVPDAPAGGPSCPAETAAAAAPAFRPPSIQNPARLAEASMRVWDLTGQTGAARYMAPEVYLCQPYGLRSETYSFSMVLWHMLTKELPYDGIIGSGGLEHFERKVVRGRQRPPTRPEWPDELRRLVEECFRPTASQRPSMAELASRLRRVYVGVGDSPMTPPVTPGSPMTVGGALSDSELQTSYHSPRPQRSGSGLAANPAVGPAQGTGPGRAMVTPTMGPAREVLVQPSAPAAPVYPLEE